MAKNCFLRKAVDAIPALTVELLDIRYTFIKEIGYGAVTDKLRDIVVDLDVIYRLYRK